MVLCPTRNKTGHFGDISASLSLGLAWKKLNLTQQKHVLTNQKKCTTTQNKHRKLKSPFTTSSLETEWVYSQRKRLSEGVDK